MLTCFLKYFSSTGTSTSHFEPAIYAAEIVYKRSNDPDGWKQYPQHYLLKNEYYKPLPQCLHPTMRPIQQSTLQPRRRYYRPQALRDRLSSLVNDHRIFLTQTNQLRGFAEIRQSIPEQKIAEIAQELRITTTNYNRLADISGEYPDRLITPLNVVPWDRKVLNLCEMREELVRGVGGIEDRYEDLEDFLEEHHIMYRGGSTRYPVILVTGSGNATPQPISP